MKFLEPIFIQLKINLARVLQVYLLDEFSNLIFSRHITNKILLHAYKFIFKSKWLCKMLQQLLDSILDKLSKWIFFSAYFFT